MLYYISFDNIYMYLIKSRNKTTSFWQNRKGKGIRKRRNYKKRNLKACLGFLKISIG